MNETKTNFWQKNWVVCIGALVCCLLWGSAFPCVKIGYQLFAVDTQNPASLLLFAGVRFLIAGLLVVAIGSAVNKTLLIPKKNNWGKVCILAIFQTLLQYIFYYIGLANTSGVKASIINGLNVVFTILSAAFIFRLEKFTLTKAIGCLVGFSGILVLNLAKGPLSASFSLLGEGFLIVSAIASSISYGFVKNFSKSESTVTLSGWQFIIGGSVLIIAGLGFGGNLTVTKPIAILLLLYLAFISAVAFSLWGTLVKHNPISKVSAYKSMNPMFGVLLSAIFLSEYDTLGWATILALVLVCAGIYIINKYGNRTLKNTQLKKAS